MVMGALERLDPPRRLGDLTLLAALGEGGMATVYLAGVGSGPLARMCAVKLLRANLPDHDYRTRFLDEARLVVRLHHNNLVDVRAAGEIDGQLYIAMEAVEGRDLADVWDRCAEVGRAFPVPLAVYITREVLRGLHYAHTFPGLGLVHRDVSPSNILIDWAGAVRLADFGLATSSLKASLTLPGVVFGKVGYMSPEQARHEPLDGRADVYAVSVILWELLTGRPLRAPEGVTTDTVSRFEAVAPSARSRRIDSSLDEIVYKGLARNRDERWESAQAMMLALNGWLADHAPEMGQEMVSDFMRKLWSNTREVEAAMRAELLREHTSAHRAAAAGTQILDEAGDTVAVAGGEPRDSRSAERSGPASPGLDAKELIPADTVIADRYRVQSRLGRGGMGYVYLGEHLTVGRPVAIKVLTFDWSRTAAVAQRFRAEARAASAPGHPNIVEVFDAGELPDGRLYLVMEFLTGRNLFEEVQNVGPIEVARACHIMRDVGRAIRAAHEVGIIHRDLKPDNVMLVNRADEGELVKVLDFGISSSGQRSEDAQRLTTVGQALGTPEYMAPEQAKGRQPDKRFDIYALGVMFYELLTGDPPFHGTNVYEIISRKTTEPAPSIATKRAGLPKELVRLVDDCLALDPEGRPQTAQLFLARLEDVLRSLPRETGSANIVHQASLTDGESPDPETEPELAATTSPPLDRDHNRNKPNKPEPATAEPIKPKFPPIYVALFTGAVIAVILGIWAASINRNKNKLEAAAGDTAALTTSGAANPGDDEGRADEAGLVDETGQVHETTGDTASEAAETGGAAVATTGEDETEGETEADTDDTGKATSRVAKHKTEACQKLRDEAKKAADSWKWDRVLELTRDRKCWASKAEHTRLVVQAYHEKKKWQECARAGKGATGKDVKRMVAICESHLE